MAAVTRAKVLLLVFLSAVAVSSTAGKKEKPLSSVADLRYGVALYHYYQTDYREALTELLIAKQRGGIQGHGDNPVLMEGGFALAYGLERYAGDIFKQVLAANVPDDAQVAAWYYLARMRYMRSDWAMSQRSIEEVTAIAERDKKSTRAIASDLDALKINLAIKQNDLPEAERILKQKNLSADWLPYMYFNLGSAYARAQQFDQAIQYFNRVAEREYVANEFRSLYDKAMTAAGYAYLLSDRQQQAMERFSRVRLDSPLSGRALLGYGWAAAERDNYREALKVWSHLSQASLIDENSQEALVAVPYAYEKLGMEGYALQQFQKAEQGFREELARLDNVIANLRGDTLLQALQIENADGVDWLNYAETNQLAPQLSYLIALFAREEFQMRVQELRDLLAVQKNNQRWREKLAFYSGMLGDRENDRVDKSTLLAKDALKKQIDTMQAQRDILAQRIENIAGSKDYFALAMGDEAELIERVQRSRKVIPLLRDTDPFIDDTEESVRWYYGMLLWEASENFSKRLWRAVKTLNGLDDAIAALRENYTSVETILSSAPDLAPYRVRIADGSLRLENQSADIDIAVDAAKEQLRVQVVSVLTEQRQRIQHYLAQSRLSVARLYDKSLKQAQTHALEAERAASNPADATTETQEREQ